MEVNWKETAVTAKMDMTLYELCDLILEMSQKKQLELVIEMLCNWSEPQQDEIKRWLEDS